MAESKLAQGPEAVGKALRRHVGEAPRQLREHLGALLGARRGPEEVRQVPRGELRPAPLRITQQVVPLSGSCVQLGQGPDVEEERFCVHLAGPQAPQELRQEARRQRLLGGAVEAGGHVDLVGICTAGEDLPGSRGAGRGGDVARQAPGGHGEQGPMMSMARE